ncbi:fumarylacetoacetate hydrolase family protein [Streptomyces iranensis]|uniref:2-keto-4-pentenoate hydratase/2-oxohepta-3-ene-1,7-dioic acid hydratase in catechol pathway n=1 Tax=Streptomyces iranensis TaxID=576784 RepID=A0ABS4MRK1_9ACTN|nr:fumarylacetoacetate hydrolase family protein [Streptomyces iranensis]MBP2062339.1 2-keto-4-pentenoate hydratase/2-oxohepta-3-ene-1,7-dioic acid hydratase in catechol pathway [Streptomyces iranensis]
MKLIGYVDNGTRHIGAVDGSHVIPLGEVSAFYADPRTATASADQVTKRLVRAELVEAPPVPQTARVFCVGINYHAHGDESREHSGLDTPKVPMIFGRWADTLVVDGDPVPVPPNEDGLDWEVELAVIIADRVWAADRATASQHVLGYTAFNDLSARKKQLETAQFTLGKNADRSGPIGPVVVTPDEIGDPNSLTLRTRVGDSVMQLGNTRDLIHDIPSIIAYITDTVSLKPGDVIATGTPAGVGLGMKPQVYLTAGDAVEVEVENIGVLRTPIVSRADLAARHEL